MKKKYLSLFLALIMILGVIPTSIFAETGVQKYKITFVASKDVGNRDYGIENVDGKGSVSVDGGQYYRFKNEGHELNYYIDGKEVNGINPEKNTTVYVGVSGWGKNYYPVEEIEKKPNGYVTVTFNSGKHGKFNKYKDSGLETERRFYVPTFKEVDLSYAVHFANIDRGWVDKGYDKPSKEGSFDKNLKGTFTKDTSFNALYEEKSFTHKFIKINKKEVTKILPANALYGELKLTAAKAVSRGPGDGSKFIGWQESSIVNGKEIKGSLLDFKQSSNWPIDGPKVFREIWSKDHQVKFYQEFSDWSDLELVKHGDTIKSRSNIDYTKYYEITKLGYFDNSTGIWIPPTYDKNKEFNFNTPIERDYNILEVHGFSHRDEDLTLFVSTFPKKNYDTSKEGEKTVDLTGLVVGVKTDDKIKYIPYENLKAQGITTEPKQGDPVETLDGKSIKVTLGDNFAYSRETFKVKDDGFKKDSIASIKIASQPKLDYKYDGDDEKAKTLDLSALSVTLTDSYNKTRTVKFKDFDHYDLITNPVNGKLLTEEDNGKPVKVSLKSKDSIFAETENLKVTTSKFDPEKVTSIAFAKGTKTNYIVGQKLDLDNLKAVLTDENGNTREVSYSDFANNKITPAFAGSDLDKALTKEDNGKKLSLTLAGNNTPAKLKISVVEFDSSKVKSITVKTQPKLDYSSGDKLDLSGLVVVLKDSNEATKEVPFNEFANNKLTTSLENGTLIDNQTGKIKITFDGKISTETDPLNVTYIKPEDRISTKEETVTETVPFKVIKKSDDTLPLGEEKIEQEGVNGSAEVKYKVTYKGTTETAREEIPNSRTIKTPAVDKIIRVGTKLAEAEEKFITVEEDIPFKIEVINDENFKGEKPEVSGGVIGKKKVTYKNNNGQKGDQVREEIISPPQDLVIKKKPSQDLPENLPKEFTVTTTETIPFETEITKDDTKDVGTKEVTQEGVDGKKVTKQKYKLEGGQYIPDGQADITETPAQNKKIIIGTKEITVDVEEKEVTEKVKIPFKTERKNNPSLEKGQEKVVQEGKDGEKEITYTVKTRGGEVLSKTKKSEKVTKEATPKIIEVGTKECESPAPSPNPGYDWIYPNYRPRYYWDYKNLSTGVTTNNNIKNKVTKPISESIQYVLKIDSKIYERIVNGQSTRLTLDVAPIIQNSRTMLPMRFVAESIGAKVEWDKATRTASFTKDGIVAKIQIDENKIILSNGETIVMDSKPLNINNRILLPITNISRVFNMTNGNTTDGIAQDIEWNAVERTVTINVK